jgi:hypothetical protein
MTNKEKKKDRNAGVDLRRREGRDKFRSFKE